MEVTRNRRRFSSLHRFFLISHHITRHFKLLIKIKNLKKNNNEEAEESKL